MSASPSIKRRAPWLLAAACAVAALCWWSWPRTPEAPEEPDAPRAAADGSVVLTERQIQTQGIASAPIQAATSVPVPGLPAEAAAPMDASARVVVPYGGVVTQLLVDEGVEVTKGQPLVRIQSLDLLAAQAALAAARSEAVAASAQARRDRTLHSEGIIPASRDEQSRARAEAAEGARRQAEGAMAALRPVSHGMPGEYELVSPMAGRLLRRDVQPGQAVAALAPAFTVARPGPLDVRFIAPVRYRKALAPGLEVGVGEGATARIVAVGADTDPASQSLRVRAQLKDEAGIVAGQQFPVTLHLPAPEGSIALPAAALLPAGEGHVLYRLEGTTVRKVVVREVLGSDGTTSVVIADGLAPGQQVVTRGTAMLKALIPAGADNAKAD